MAATGAEKSEADYLCEARLLCRQIGNVWYAERPVYDPKQRASVYIYRVYREGTGFFAQRASAKALVALLKKQLPKVPA